MRVALLASLCLPLPAAPCSECHTDVARKQSASHHAAALRPIADSPLPHLFRDNGGLTYSLQSGLVLITSTTGLTATLEWAFGAGAQGITPVGTIDGRAFEHRFSYYPKAQRFALTFGHPSGVATPEAAFGVPQDAKTLARCFSCHSTGGQPGITCDRCHGPPQAHIEAARAGVPEDALRRTIVNPGRFPAKAQIEFCGACHRLPEPGNDSPEPELEDPVNVRFAPIGLLASRCFQASKRLTCTTCHDPHDNARPRTDDFYVQRCRDCHAQSKSHCPRPAKSDCLTCHMPQASLGRYLTFTNHRIHVP